MTSDTVQGESAGPAASPTRPLTFTEPEPEPRRRRRRRQSGPRNDPRLFLFLIPAVVIYLWLVLWPTVQAFRFSLTDWDGLSATFNEVGLGTIDGSSAATAFSPRRSGTRSSSCWPW